MHGRRWLTWTLALAIAGWSGVASSHAAESFGSIAFSPTTGANGFVFGSDSKDDAERRAMKECRKRASDCIVGINFWNSCGAVAIGSNAGWGSAWATSGDLAQQEAMKYCRQRDRDCRVIRWQCSIPE
jgi:hypothetical protein